MRYDPIPEDYANAIWDALVKYAGALEHGRREFIAHREHITEFRFQGNLMFGGKFYNRDNFYNRERITDFEWAAGIIEGGRIVFKTWWKWLYEKFSKNPCRVATGISSKRYD